MSEPTALIAEARGFAAGSESARATLMRDLADALEQSQAEVQRLHAVMGRGFVETLKDRDEAYAELRQERERAGSLTTQRDTARHESVEWENAFARTEVVLSRAEETIARIDGEVKNFEQSDNDALCEIERHLTEYGKQKGADDA